MINGDYKWFSLSQVVIGCKNDCVYEKLREHVSKMHRLALWVFSNEDDHDCSANAVDSALHLMAETNVLKHSVKETGEVTRIIERHHPIPLYMSNTAGLSLSQREETTVLSTGPCFSKGFISHSTELIIVRITPSSEDCAIRRQSSPPIVSDFLAHYDHKNADALEVEVQIMTGSDMMKYVTEGHLPDLDSALGVSTHIAHRLGVMSGAWVKVKLNIIKAQSRHMRVVVLASDLPCDAVLTDIGWFNLGGSPLRASRIQVKKALNVDPDLLRSVSASAPHIDTVQDGKLVTVSGIIQPHAPNPAELSDALHQYFSMDRYLSIGDVFVVSSSKASLVDEKQIYMKVVKVNGFSKSKLVFRINKSFSTLYQAVAVHSFVPTNHGVNVGGAVAAIRSKVVNALQPFIREDWTPSPLPVLLFAGPQGSHKCRLARQIALLAQCNFLQLNCVHLVADTVASSEARVKDIISQAHSLAPCILLLRNIENLGREEPIQHINPRIIETFQRSLEESMQSSTWPIIVLGSCRKLGAVAEGIREMVLDEIHFEVPDATERCHILADLCASITCHESVDIDHLAEHTAGFVYGDIDALASHARRNSIIRAIRESEHQLGFVHEDAILKSGVLVTAEDFEEALRVIQGSQSRDLGTPKIPNVSWEDIGGLDSVKEDILDTIQLPLQHPELFLAGLRRSGILLYGPPGTGKTLLAKAVATECSLNFFSVKGPELINMYVGQSEENVRNVFSRARGASPCVIFFDELDSLAPNRGRSGDSGGVMDRVVSQLLAELDGLHKSCDVFVVGATNRPDLLDPALLRPGRFDKLIYVGVSSSPSEQLTILKALTRKFKLAPGCDLTKVVQYCPKNLTGADLYALAADAITSSMKKQIEVLQTGGDIGQCAVEVTMEDFMSAVEGLVPSLSANDIERYEQIRASFNNSTQQSANST